MVAEPAAMQGPGKIISLDGRRRLMEDATEEKAKREPAVAIPLVYTQMLKGDARAAMFLAQVLFHQRSEKAVDGWFWHTLEQWEDELGFSDEAESRCCKTLKGYGLQTKVKAVNHIPKKHYHVDEDALQEKVNEFRHLRLSRKCEKQQKLASVAKSIGYISTSGKAVNDGTSGFSVNSTSVEPVNGTSGKAEDLQGKEDIDLKTQREETNSEANASFGADASADTPSEVLPPAEDDGKTAPPSKKQKNKIPAFAEDDLDFQTARYLRNAIHRYAPKAAIPPDTVKGLQAWANDIRLLRDGSHKRAREDIKTAILFTERTVKWQSYVLSPSGLRRWFDAILQQAEAQREGKTNGQSQRRQTTAKTVEVNDYDKWREESERRTGREGNPDPPNVA